MNFTRMLGLKDDFPQTLASMSSEVGDDNSFTKYGGSLREQHEKHCRTAGPPLTLRTELCIFIYTPTWRTGRTSICQVHIGHWSPARCSCTHDWWWRLNTESFVDTGFKLSNLIG
jgi:hypothetical protein